MLRVFGDRISGNCLKIKWLLDHLGRPYQWVDVDILSGATRTAEFLAMNPAGQVPVVRFEDGRCLAQSNAIVLYLAEATPLVPSDPFARAQVLEWLFWEQYSHEPYLAVRRFHRRYLNTPDAELDPRLLEKGNAALTRMDQHLATRPFLVDDAPSVADLCLLPYTRFAPEGGFDLASFPHVCAWADRTSAALGQ